MLLRKTIKLRCSEGIVSVRFRQKSSRKKEREREKDIKHLAMEFKPLRTTGALAFDSDV